MGIVYFLHVSLHEILFFFSVLFIVYVQQQLDLPTKDDIICLQWYVYVI